MRLYTSHDETEVLLGALNLLKLQTSQKTVEDSCDRLIARITDCQELQITQLRKRDTKGRKGKS